MLRGGFGRDLTGGRSVLMSETMSPVYARRPEAVSCAVGDGVAILDMRSNIYFTLNDVGALVWDLLDGPASAGLIVDRLVAACDTAGTPRARIEQDVAELLADLARAELVTVSAA